MADEYRQYNSKREIIKLDLVQPNDYTDSVILCVPKFAYDVARSMLLHYGRWRTSYAVEYGELFYKLPNDAQWDTILSSIDEFLGSRDMSCDLVDALENINATLRAQTCCTSGSGGQFIDDDFYYGTQSPLIAPASFGGSGDDFASIEAWEIHKCQAANAIAEGLIWALNSWSTLSLASLTAGAIGVGIAAIFITPPVAIFLALAAQGILFGALATIANAVSDSKAELVCLLYNSDSAASAYDNLVTFMDDVVIDLGFIELEANLVVSLIMQFAPIDTMNSLFSSVGLPAVSDPIDCASCAECPDYRVSVGTDLGDGEVSSTQNAENGWQYVTILFNRNETDWCGGQVTVNSISITENTCAPVGGGDVAYRYYTQANVLIGTYYNTPPVNVPNVGKVIIHVVSTANPDFYSGFFSAQFNWTE
jgi:hypothetical protein